MTGTPQDPTSARRTRRGRPAIAAVAGAGLLLTAVLSGCGARHDRNGDTERPDVQQLPVLQTVLPSKAPNPELTVSPYPSSTVSYMRGDEGRS